MPALVAVLVYWFRVLRRPMDVRLKRRHVGGSAVLTLGAGMIVLWVQERPMTLPGRYEWGELAGVMAVYLFTWSLLLATRARWLEPWFGGLDRMYLWHKRAAIAGTLLVLPHFTVTGAAPGRPANTAGLALGVISLLGIIGLVVISLPRAARILRLSYYRWKFLHRLMGLFVAASVVHGLVLDQVIASSLVLRVVFLIVGTAGFLCYLYEELLMRHLLPTADYTVTSVTRPAEHVVELRLTPSGPGITPQPGQFVFLHVGGDGAWHEHPFSVAGTGPGRQLRLSVRAPGARNTNPVRRADTRPARDSQRSLRHVRLHPRWPRSSLDRRRHRCRPIPQLAAGAHIRGSAQRGALLHRPNRSRCRIPA